ncbi:YbaN family protein [Labrenzia sp. 011]|uniref:YbaN family protein n=1 Tax=Labrenzia sp. 011 TaxID=2171494 RepID=UPI001AD8C695|nr:YbaN family protein [Labrenzia sp. 011]
MRILLNEAVPTARRAFWLFLGTSALGLGALGAVLPILPTTPFVILAAFSFGKSAPRIQATLESNPVFGPVITDWRESGAIAPRFKLLSIAMMAGVFALSLALSVSVPVLCVQALCMAGAAIFILGRPSPAA